MPQPAGIAILLLELRIVIGFHLPRHDIEVIPIVCKGISYVQWQKIFYLHFEDPLKPKFSQTCSRDVHRDEEIASTARLSFVYLAYHRRGTFMHTFVESRTLDRSLFLASPLSTPRQWHATLQLATLRTWNVLGNTLKRDNFGLLA